MDRETGMYYYGARYYDPRISIFVSVDPLAEEFPNYGGYVYTMNNPINLIDPTGMAPEDWIFYFKGGLLSGFEDTGKGNKIHIVNDGQSLFHRSDIQRRSEMNQITNFIGKRINKDLSYSYEEVNNTRGGWYLNNNVTITNNSYLSGNYNDVVSSIEHESLHHKNGKTETFMNHVNIYMEQAESDTFKNTSSQYKRANAGAVAQRLVNAYANDEIDYKTLKKTASKYNSLNPANKISWYRMRSSDPINETLDVGGKSYKYKPNMKPNE